MKLFVIFPTLFAFICFAQAEIISLRLILSHETEPKEIGEIKGFVIGKNEKKEFTLAKTLLLSFHSFLINIDFPEEVEKISIQSNDDFPQSTSIYPIAILSNFNKGYSYYEAVEKSFSFGDTLNFVKDFSISKN